MSAPAVAGKGDSHGEPTPMELAGIALVVKLDESEGYTPQHLERDFPVKFESALLASRSLYLFSPTDPETAHSERKVDGLAHDLKKDGDYVKYAEPDYATELADNRYHSWPAGTPEAAGDRSGPFYSQPLSQRLRIDEVHERSTGTGARIAVLDTGVQVDHPALAGSLEQGFDYIDDDADPSEAERGLDSNGNGIVDEAFGHGTFVAGVIKLIAPGARVVPMRVLDSDGAGSVFLVAQAIIEAADAGVDVINVSMGTSEEIKSKLMKDVLDYADDLGVQVVAAAGNANTDAYQYPAKNRGVVSVTSTMVDKEDELPEYANYGRWVDLAAPSDHVLGPIPGDEYAWWAGTSMAAPQVSAQMALLQSFGAAETDDQMKAIEKSTKKINKELKKDVKHGSINLIASLDYLAEQLAKHRKKNKKS